MAIKLITDTARKHVYFCNEILLPEIWYTLYSLPV